MIDNNYPCWTIIVHYNGAEWIEKCLDSFSNTKFEDKIIVVDNCSTDIEGVQIITNKFPKTVLIKLNENIGFGRANNVGIELAIEKKAQYVFLLNQDAWVCEDDTIENLIQVAKNNPEFGIVSPIHYNSTKTALDQGFAAYMTKSKNVELLSKIFHENNDSIYEIPFVNAAAWLLNVKCFKKIGFFDPDFFMYGEDTDLINRVLFHKMKLGITPLANICHAREHRSKDFPKTHLTNSEKIQHQGRYLSILKNINENIFNSFLKFITESGMNVLNELLSKRWNRAFQLVIIVIQLIVKLPNIITKRHQYKIGFLQFS
jgi:GT2 family glycosyltransferase